MCIIRVFVSSYNLQTLFRYYPTLLLKHQLYSQNQLLLRSNFALALRISYTDSKKPHIEMTGVQAESQGVIIDIKNPHGLGDPDDKSLRRVEQEVLIPKIMRERAKTEHCVKEVQDFEACCKANNILMVVTCRKENSALKACLAKWYKNEEFKEECKQIYLQERADYRRTGIPKKHRVQKV